MAKKKASVELPVANGQVIAGRYAVSGIIGRGGMGIVLAGRHLELGERVAIKFLHKEHASHADRFFREARAAARIRSEHVVRIFDVGRLNTGEPYIVMEHLEGEDLDARVERVGNLDVQTVADILLQVCQALAEAHAAGIVHRDLKPANIFLAKSPGRDDLVKLLDFGVAKVPDGGAITKTASVLGSPIYMSPEQLMATRDVDARSDIWSLGIILYELLTGEYPFEGDSLVHLAMVIREKETPSVRALRPDLPEGIERIISKCLEKDRGQRYDDVGQFAAALVEFASPSVSHSVSRIQRIVAEKAQRLALASTESDDPAEEDDDDDDDDDLGTTATVDNAVPEPAATALEVPRSRRGAKTGSSPESAPLSASLAAVSSSSSSPLGVEKRKRLPAPRLAAVLGALALVGLGGAVQRFLFAPTPVEPPVASKAASLVSEAAALPSTSMELVPPPSSAAPEAAAPTASPPPSLLTADKPPAPRPTRAAAPATSAKPAAPSATVTCTPPFWMDEKGVKHPKPECI